MKSNNKKQINHLIRRSKLICCFKAITFEPETLESQSKAQKTLSMA